MKIQKKEIADDEYRLRFEAGEFGDARERYITYGSDFFYDWDTEGSAEFENLAHVKAWWERWKDRLLADQDFCYERSWAYRVLEGHGTLYESEQEQRKAVLELLKNGE